MRASTRNSEAGSGRSRRSSTACSPICSRRRRSSTSPSASACSETRKFRFLEAFQLVEGAIDATYKDLTRSVQFATGGQAVLTLTNPDVRVERAFHG